MMMEIAGDAIEAACRIEKRQPTAIVVLWAFSLASAMTLYREGFAHRHDADTWAMNHTAIDQVWPGIEEGLNKYLRICIDVSVPSIVGKEEFFSSTVPSALSFLTDVRFQREQSPADLLSVLIERYGENVTESDPSEVRLMIYVAKRLFNTVGLVDPGY